MSDAFEDTQPAARDSGPLLPPRISRFEVRAKLGEGGNGVVFLARDPSLDREVAIKILRRADHPGAEQRLLREAQSAAKLAHENVIVVHEVGTHEEQVYVAMEYVPGGTLTQWQRGKPWRDVLEVYLRAGRGLAAAHTAGMVHRDFKPDNVLVADDGRVRVTDFGLVSVSSGRPPDDVRDLALTKTGTVMGTPRYMAPEQHLGEDVDARADQFAFCAALYEALYGRPPFSGDTYGDLADRVLAGKVEPPPAGSPVPATIRAAILRGLSRARDERFAALAELLAAIATPAPSRRRWIVPVASIAVAGIVATAFAVVRTGRGHGTSPRAPAGSGAVVEGSADDAYRAGEAAYNAGDFAKAVVEFKRGFALEPNLSKKGLAYLYNTYQAYRQIGNCAEAAFALERYLALKTDLGSGFRKELEQRARELDDCAAQQGSATR